MAPSHTTRATSLRATVVLIDAIGFASVTGVAAGLRSSLEVSDWFPLKAAAVFSLIMLIVLARIGTTHPFARVGPANQVTAVRAMLVALIAGLLGEPATPAAGAFVAATSLLVTALDGLDGWLARRSRMASAFGARFDMEVDAVLVLTLSLLAWRFGKAGGWIVLSGLLRYLFVAAGRFAPRLERPLPPSRRRQAVCVVQIAGLSAIMLPGLTPPSTTWMAAGLLAALGYSFLTDILWLWRRID